MYGNDQMKKRLIDCIENCENEGYAIDSIETDTKGIHDISISVDLIKVGEGRTQKEELPEINVDELVGFILRNLSDYRNISLTYEEVKEVLEMEEAFLKSEGIIEPNEKE